MKSLLLAASLLVLVLAVACAEDAEEEESPTGVPPEIVDVIDEYVRTTGLDGNTDGRRLTVDCAEIGAEPALCVDAELSTVLETEATVRIYANQSDASWDVSLLQRDGWTVTKVTEVGVR